MSARRRRRAAVLGVPALIAATLTFLALWRLGSTRTGEPGAAGTIGLHADRHASFDRIPVRQVTSDRTFWVGSLDEDPIFVVSRGPVRLEPGAEVTISGRIERAPDVDVAKREWGVNEATARAVRERGVYVKAAAIRAVANEGPPPKERPRL